MMRSVGAHVHLTSRDWTPFSVAFRQELGESLIFVKCRVRFQQLVAPLSELSFRYSIIECAMGHDLGVLSRCFSRRTLIGLWQAA